MNWRPGNASHIGRRRQQQDAFALSDFDDALFTAHGGYLAVVADGIGGLLHGAQAAQSAVAGFLKHYLAKSPEQAIDDVLDAALTAAHDAVWTIAEAARCSGAMGSTLVAAVIHDDRLYWRAVGDSRLYLLRGGRLAQLNGDHTLARELQMQVNEGLLDQSEAERHPDRDVLDSFIGSAQPAQVAKNIRPLVLEADDIVLLCSDGIYRTLNDEQIVACLDAPPMLAAERLLRDTLACHDPAQDNVTAVVLRRDASSRPAGGWMSRWWTIG